MTQLNASGLRMGLEELTRLITLLEVRERLAVEAFARAEQDVNLCRRLLAFVRVQQAEYRERLAVLEEQQR